MVLEPSPFRVVVFRLVAHQVKSKTEVKINSFPADRPDAVMPDWGVGAGADGSIFFSQPDGPGTITVSCCCVSVGGALG